LEETLSKEITIKAHKGLLHNGEELYNGFTPPKTLDAFSNRLIIDT